MRRADDAEIVRAHGSRADVFAYYFHVPFADVRVDAFSVPLADA